MGEILRVFKEYICAFCHRYILFYTDFLKFKADSFIGSRLGFNFGYSILNIVLYRSQESSNMKIIMIVNHLPY